jgi:hypothetical protein
MTALGQIFAEIDVRLEALAGIESYQRMPSGDPDVFPALEVYDNGDLPAEFEAATTQTELEISVVGVMEGHGGAATHDAMIALHAVTVFALCGDAGTNLGGLVENIEARGRRVVVAKLAEKRRLSFAQDFIITLATPRGDPRTFA